MLGSLSARTPSCVESLANMTEEDRVVVIGMDGSEYSDYAFECKFSNWIIAVILLARNLLKIKEWGPR